MGAEEIGSWIGGAGGVIAVLWAGFQLFRSLSADSREAVNTSIAALRSETSELRVRVTQIELDEREEKGLGLPAKVVELERRVSAVEGSTLAEIRSAREKLTEVADGIEDLLGGRQDDS